MISARRETEAANAREIARLARLVRLDRRHALHFVSVEPLATVENAMLQARAALEPGVSVAGVILEPGNISPIDTILRRVPQACLATPEHPENTADDHWVAFVFGLTEVLGEENPDRERALAALNGARDRLRKLRAPTVFWVAPGTLDQIASRLPDLWSWTSSVTRLSFPVSDGDLPAVPGYAAAIEELDEARRMGAEQKWAGMAARLRDSLTRVKRFQDRYHQAQCLQGLGLVTVLQGRLDEAETLLQEALDLFRDVRNRSEEARVLFELGTLFEIREQFEPAARHFRPALVLYRHLRDLRGQASTLHRLGPIEQLLGDYQAAQRYHEEALTLHRALGLTELEGMTLANLAFIAEARGEWDASRDYLLGALAVSTQREDAGFQESMVQFLARLWRSTGDARVPAAVADVLRVSETEAEAMLLEAKEPEPSE